MATRPLLCFLAGLLILLCPHLGWSQSGRVTRATDTSRAACVLAWSSSKLTVREATGRNDGPEIDSWARATGTALRSPWCGLYQWAGQQACGLPVPKGAAGSYNWFMASSPRTYFIKGVRGSVDSIRPGHQVGFYYANLRRIGHIGRAISPSRVPRRGNARGWYTNEGNTGTGGGRDGAGVHLLLRASWEFYAAANWLH